MFNELDKKNIQSAICYYPEFLRKIKSSFQDDFNSKIEYIKNVPLLLLDDIGAENVTSWSRDEILATILQYRMESNLPTFFTSNCTLKQLEEHFSKSSSGIEELKAGRLIERIKYLTNQMELTTFNRRNDE
ncbi:MAG: primosomal protein DnaI, partial [Bacilli bacterium]